MKLKDLTTPLNKKELIGKPILFAVMPKARIIRDGKATITYNILTGHFFVEGQKGRITPYVMSTIKNAICLAKTINCYNETSKRVTFKNGNINELELF